MIDWTLGIIQKLRSEKLTKDCKSLTQTSTYSYQEETWTWRSVLDFTFQASLEFISLDKHSRIFFSIHLKANYDFLRRYIAAA